MIDGRKGKTKIAILTITPEERDEASAVFQLDANVLGTAYYVKELSSTNHYDLLVRMASDRTNVPAAEVVGEIVEDFRPEFLLLAGTAGGHSKREDTKVGDVVIGDFVDYTEFQKIQDGKFIARKLPYDHPSLYLRESIAEPIARRGDWVASIKRTRPSSGKPSVIIGQIAAGEKILSDTNDGYQKQMMRMYDKAVAFETESYGVARAIFKARNSVHYNVRYLSIRGVSDLIDKPGSNKQRKLWTPYAASAACSFAQAVAERMLKVYFL